MAVPGLLRPDSGLERPVARPPAREFRPELQGLRALAVTLVVIYHIWLNRVSGGVDVFFAISGFLLTGQLLRAAGSGPLRLVRRWSRTVVRLVPSMAVVLVLTGAAGMMLLPEGRWAQTVRELLAAGLFVENWRLAADSVDYAARSNVPSVVQHFWSLAVQGQFFLVWPLLVAGVVLAARGVTARIRPYLTAAVTGVLVLSLGFSIELTATDQPLAYFHSLTRLWEFALGGLLALYLGSRRAVPLPRPVRVGLGWVGVLGLVVCGLVFQASSVFPGVAALWPTGCAVLVLLAGTTGERFAVDRILTARPVMYLGELSFTLYLWHWPVLILYRVSERPAAIGLAGLGIVAASLVLAVLTHHLVERPVLGLRLGVRGGYRLGALAVAAVLLVVGGWQTRIVLRTETGAQLMDVDHPGALALVGGEPAAAPVLPPPVSVLEDWVRIERWNCTQLARFPMNRCTMPMDGPPAKRIVVVGDSHLQQISGALVPIARAQHWQLTVIARGACPFSTVSEVNPDEADCLNWNTAAEAEIADLHPDAVVTLASRNVRVGLTEQTPPGFVAQWRRLDALHIPVLAIRDNPRWDSSMPDCVQNFTNCGAPRDQLYTVDPPWTKIHDLPSNVSFLDIANDVCTATFCPAEIGNVLVYLDDNHLSASYSTSMSGLVADAVVAALSRAAPTR